MAAWQKRARAGAAIVGLVSAVVVYFAFSGRRATPSPNPIHRAAPQAIAEAYGSIARRFGKGEIGRLEAESWQQFENGTKFFKVKIVVPKGERTFTVTADEAFTGTNEVEIELKNNVRLEDSDGFWLLTDRGTFNQNTYLAMVPGAATFGKGRMSGSGTNLTYDQQRDVLSVLEQAQITTVNDEIGRAHV